MRKRRTPHKVIQEEGLGWTHGHLGDWSETDVTKRYNVSGIPASFLIGPDGRIVARDLRGAALLEALERTLGDKKQIAKNRTILRIVIGNRL